MINKDAALYSFISYLSHLVADLEIKLL